MGLQRVGHDWATFIFTFSQAVLSPLLQWLNEAWTGISHTRWSQSALGIQKATSVGLGIIRRSSLTQWDEQRSWLAASGTRASIFSLEGFWNLLLLSFPGDHSVKIEGWEWLQPSCKQTRDNKAMPGAGAEPGGYSRLSKSWVDRLTALLQDVFSCGSWASIFKGLICFDSRYPEHLHIGNEWTRLYQSALSTGLTLRDDLRWSLRPWLWVWGSQYGSHWV